ncbi:MAG: nidogen-like domain-containing protein [Flavobacteriales bacterium]
MRHFLLLFGLLLVSTLSAQKIILDSKQYEALKTNNALDGADVIAVNTTNTSQKYKGTQSQKTGLCDCLVPLDSTFLLAMLPNDDSYSNSIQLPFNFSFYGTTYDSLYINNNGNISFTQPYYTFTANPFPDPSFNMIAPFWADVDTRSPNGGNVWYKTNAHSVIIVWDHVGYFPTMEDKLNTFQLIISDGLDTLIPNGNNVSFCYGDMQWTTGSASGGANGFGGSPATVGVNIGNGINYFQVGQFDTTGVSFDGPYTSFDGVDFLDGQEIYFNLANTNSNIPPLIMSSGICDTIDVFTGDTLKSLNAIDFTLGISTPELGQVLTTTITSDQPNALTFTTSSVSTEYTSYDLTFDATGVQPGLYHVIIETTDNGTPAHTVLKNIPIRVIYDVNLAGLNNLSSSVIQIFPNPTSASIFINGLHTNDLLELHDASGKIVLKERVADTSDQLYLPHVGFYILKHTSNAGFTTFHKIQRN